MPRKITLAVVWVVTTMGSMLVVGSAIGIVRDQVVDQPAALPDVAALNAAGSTSSVPATTLTPDADGAGSSSPAILIPATSAVGPSTAAPSTPIPEPPETSVDPPVSAGPPTTTSTTTAARATTTTPAPTTTATIGPVQLSTYQLVGGWVRIGSRPGEVFLDGAGAAPGFAVDIEKSGPDKVSVEFSSHTHESEFQAEWHDGDVDVQIEEKPEGS